MPSAAEAGQPSFRRRIPLELTADELALLEAGQPRHGNKRATLVAGLRALARVAGVEEELAAAARELEQERVRAKTLEERAATAEAAAKETAAAKKSAGRDDREVTKERRRREAAEAELARVVREHDEERDRLEEELGDLAELVPEALRCARCRKWAPPEEWAFEADGEHELIYHEPCGLHGTGGMKETSLLGYRSA